jgi:hypothetical protein
LDNFGCTTLLNKIYTTKEGWTHPNISATVSNPCGTGVGTGDQKKRLQQIIGMLLYYSRAESSGFNGTHQDQQAAHTAKRIDHSETLRTAERVEATVTFHRKPNETHLLL